MKRISVLILPLILMSCASTKEETPVKITEIKYVDRVVVQNKLVCCNCEIVESCPLEGKLETNGDLANTYKCLVEQKKIYNDVILACSK